jgi:hypothetical protein
VSRLPTRVRHAFPPELAAACAAALLAVLAPPAAAQAEGGAPPTVTVSRAAVAPVLDGRLDDPAWRDAVPISDFHQHTPRYRGAPSERTVVRVTYDDDYIYIAAEMFDREPQKIRATQLIQGRDISADDRFWVSLDTFNSKRNDYYFEVNPNGIRGEALRENNSKFIAEWDTIWDAASRIGEHGWITEIAIPFKSLSFDPRGGTWRINCGRWIMHKQEFEILESNDRLWWAADSREMYGISGVRQGVGLDVVSSLTLVERRNLAANTSSTELQPSADFFYRLTPSLTGALTLNSDFSTAEVDEAQVALDRFSLFFPEKRDFFLQDAGIFEFGNLQTNGRPFFSRRIGLTATGAPIGLDAGAKFTGRAGRFNVGALAVRQQAAEGVGAKDLFVARASANVLDESAVGVIVTNGDPLSARSNTLYGADFFYRTRSGPYGGTLQGYLWMQRTQTPGLTGKDTASGAALEYPNDRVNWRLAAQQIEANFNPALGFVSRRGIAQYDGTFRYRSRPGSGRVREIDQEVGATLVDGTDGERQSQLLRIRPLRLATRSNDSLYVEWQQSRERVDREFTLFRRLRVPAAGYTFDQVRIEASTGTQRRYSVVASLQQGEFFGGDRRQKAVDVQWRASEHFFMRLGYTENDVELPLGAYTSRLARMQADVALNADWSISTLVQYDNAADALGGNLRVRYQPVDGRELLLVVNSSFDIAPDDRFVNTRNEAFLKFNYTFRF